MKKGLFAVLTWLFVAAVLVIAFEGVYSLTRGREAHASLTYQVLEGLGLAGKAKRAEGAYAAYFTDAGELSDLIEPCCGAGLGRGNKTIKETHTHPPAMYSNGDHGGRGRKPKQRKKA
jgi:hypothetical protein